MPPYQPIRSQIYRQHSKHTPAAPLHNCKFTSLSFLSSHTLFRLGPSHATPPLRVLVAVGAALSNAYVLFDPILDFKGKHLIPALCEVGAVGGGWAWGRTVGREYNDCNRWIGRILVPSLCLFSLCLPLPPEDLVSTDR